MEEKEEHHANDSEHDGVVNDSKDNDAPSERAYFFDAEVLKSEVRKRLFKDPYDVRKLYKPTKFPPGLLRVLLLRASLLVS